MTARQVEKLMEGAKGDLSGFAKGNRLVVAKVIDSNLSACVAPDSVGNAGYNC